MNAPAIHSEAPIRSGPGVRVTSTPVGFTVSGTRKGQRFTHPFHPMLGAFQLQLSKGLIIGVIAVEPTIKGIPMSGDAKHQAPFLKLDPKVMDPATQTSWACVEVTPNRDGSLAKDSLVEIVHRNGPRVIFGFTGREPLAQILWKNGKPISVFPIAMYNFKYERSTPGASSTTWRHWFT